MRMWGAVAIAAAAVILGAAGAAAPIAFPAGFRSWTHVSSALLGEGGPPKYQGLHHIYGNRAAIEGLKSGRYADGAVFVYDQWTAGQVGAATTAGERRFVDVMVRDSRRFAATGGWGYAEFAAPDHRRVAEIEQDPQGSCHACHERQATRGFVFSRWRD